MSSKIIEEKEQKFHDVVYAKLGGIKIQQLIELENEFIEMIDYELFVSSEQYYKY